MLIEEINRCEAEGSRGIFQSPFWAYFKSLRGYRVQSFFISYNRFQFPLIMIYRPFAGSQTIGYIPYGPEMETEEEPKGLFLEQIAEALRPHLQSSCTAVRFDLPWKNPYLHSDGEITEKIPPGNPGPRVREMRMNFGSRNWNLLKAPTDIQPTDTFLIDLNRPEQQLLMLMKKKTRYNIRLADRKGVKVGTAQADSLADWYKMYTAMSCRKRITREEYSYFRQLLESAGRFAADIRLLTAEYHGEMIGGIIIGLYKRRAYYLYGASQYSRRNLMAPYAMQWEAIRTAKKHGCMTYDLFGVPPQDDPAHPMYGLYRFKSGFGGAQFHRRGCWDYPLDEGRYKRHAMRSAMSNAYHRRN